MPLKLGIDLDIKEADAKIQKLEAAWEKAAQQVERQKQKIQELNKEVEEHEKLLELAKKSGQDISKDTWAKELKQRLAEANTELKRLEANATLAGIKLKKALSPQENNASNITNSLSNIGNSFKNVLPSSVNMFKNALSGIGGIFNNLISGITGFISRVGKLATYTFVFNVINAAFRDMREYMSYLVGANNDLSSSLAQVRGNLLTAFQPIWETILPYLIKFTEWLAKATAYIATFINTLLGKSEQQSRATAKRTQEQIALSNQSSKALNKQKKSTDKLTAAEKKRHNVLAKFDELNVIKEHEDKSKKLSATPTPTGGAGVGGAGVSFDTSNIDTSGIQAFVDKVKNFFLPLQAPFDRLLQSLDRLKGYALEAFGDFYNLFLKPLSEYVINEALPHFLNSIADMLDRMDFEKVNEGLRELWKALEPFLEEVEDTALWFIDKFLIPLAEWTVNDAVPEFLRTLTNCIKLMTKALKILKPILEDLYEKIIKPLGDYLNDKFHDIMDDINYVLEKLQELLDKNQDKITKIANAITTVLAVAFKILGTTFDGVFELMRGTFRNFITFCTNQIDNLINLFDGIVDFIEGVFSGDWKRAFKGLGNIVVSILNMIITTFEYGINTITNGFNFLIRKVNGALGTLNQFTGLSIPSVPEIPKATLPRVPYLANGAVIPPNSPFLAMLGDQRQGTNIEAPLDTIKQAFTEALQENNMNGSGSYTFVAQLDGRTIFEETVRQNDMYINQSGRSAFAY